MASRVVQLLARARKELRRGNRYVAEHAPNYVWRFFDSPAAHHAARRAACETFAADIRTTSQHYLAAALPTLPFPDGSSQGPVADSGANPRR